MATLNNLGFLKGEVCGRDGCVGVIEEIEKEGSCSCHINPPCSYCVDAKEYCPECGWEAIEDQKSYKSSQANIDYYKRQENEFRERRERILKMMRKELPISGFEYLSEYHTHFSMIKKGVYPSGMTMEQVRENVKGTFGGRFTKFKDGVFEYIAYTD